MQSARSLAIYTLILGITLFTQTGCKENTILNANVAPSVDNISGDTASLNIVCKTIFTDSIVTSYSFSGISIIHGLGTVNDPYFGRTNAGIYFQIAPPTSQFSFPANITYDSAVLILPYSGFTWGDSAKNISQTITAYRITDTMSVNSTYYAFNTKAVDRSIKLGSTPVIIDNLSEPVVTGPTNGDTTMTRSPHLRIKLDSNAFIAKINAKSGQPELNDAASFLAYFNGIYLEADPRSNGAAIPYFYIDGSTDYTRAGVLFYYHVAGDTTSRTVAFPYTSGTCAHFNHVVTNFRGSRAEPIIGAAANNTNPLLLQNLPGCMMDVYVTGIRSSPFYTSTSLINKAQLIVSRQSNTLEDEVYSSPYRIYPIGIDAIGATYTIADGYPITSTAPLAFIDGTKRDPDGVSPNTHYLLNMPRELQAAIKAGKDTLHLHITGTTDFPGAFRLVAGGSDNSATKIRFNVVYSKKQN